MSEKNCEGRGMGRQQERLWQAGTSLVPCGFSLRLVEVECLRKMAPRSPLPCSWWSNWKSGCSGRHTEHFFIGKNLDEGQGWMFEKYFFPRHVFWGYCFARSPQRILSLFQNRIVMLLQPWLWMFSFVMRSPLYTCFHGLHNTQDIQVKINILLGIKLEEILFPIENPWD